MFTGRFFVRIVWGWMNTCIPIWWNLHHDGAQIIGGFENGQDALDDANHARNECPAENQIQQAHPKTPCTKFVYAKRAEQQGHGDVDGFVAGMRVLGGVGMKRVQKSLFAWVEYD